MRNRRQNGTSALARIAAARAPRDDFFCWKFRVWYNLGDCVFRHVYRTTRECEECEQGAANARLVGRHPDPPRWVRLLSADDLDACGAAPRRSDTSR